MPISVRKLYKVSGGSSHRDTLFVRIILIMGYETLRNINLLKSIIPTLDIRDSEKKELEGEAAFMTAYVYFYLAEKFGGVPLIKELQEYDPANPGALVVPRSTEYDTWDYVMQQCDLASRTTSQRAFGQTGNQMGRHWL